MNEEQNNSIYQHNKEIQDLKNNIIELNFTIMSLTNEKK